MTKVGHFIRRVREARGMSQEQLANRAEISQTWVSAIELGKRLPGRATGIRIARALDVQPGAILNTYCCPHCGAIVGGDE